MKTTNGTMKIKLHTDKVPSTTTNFIALSKKGYYNDIIFHRIIKGFMIQ
jgi:cyclophilin family peptidyl-prolyl cis-trans isomerase